MCLLKSCNSKLLIIGSFHLESGVALTTHFRLSRLKCLSVHVPVFALTCFPWSIRVLKKKGPCRRSALFVLLMTKHYTVIPVCALLTLHVDRGSSCLLFKVIRPVWVFSGIFLSLFPDFQVTHTHTHSPPLKREQLYKIFTHPRFFKCYYICTTAYFTLFLAIITIFKKKKILSLFFKPSYWYTRQWNAIYCISTWCWFNTFSTCSSPLRDVSVSWTRISTRSAAVVTAWWND